MTMIFSTASTELITMTVDSAITNEFSNNRVEFDTGRKAYHFDGIGCVTTWGERTGNKIAEYLKNCNLDSSKHSVVELAHFVEKFLTQEYLPDRFELGEVGYHVGGFDRDQKSRLFHIFWSFDRPRIPDQKQPRYGVSDHSPQYEGQINFVFNGRNDLADAVVRLLLREQELNPELTKFNLRYPIDTISFGNFVARFAAEFTPQVGPPFYTFFISPNNEFRYLRNEEYSPLDHAQIKQKLDELGEWE